MKRVVIAGAGIAGLSIAWALRRRNPAVEVVVLERSPQTGGNIRTEHVHGYTCEAGPDGFLDNAPATLKLIADLGLSARLLPSNDAARTRYVVHDGRLRAIPTSVAGWLKTPLLSAAGKLRIALEPFARRRPERDESIYEFAQRRIGDEAASVLIAPMVSGIFAGDAHALSLAACFPKMSRMEERHGSLVRAMLATRRTRRRMAAMTAPGGRLTSFEGGMADLTDGLTRTLGNSIRRATGVTGLCRHHAIAMTPSPVPGPRYSVTTTAEPFEADGVVLSGLAAESAAILRQFDPTLAALLDGIPTAPLAVVCLGYDERLVASHCHLDGFGFLVPPGERFRVLGALWETSIYRHRAPAGKVLLRVMIGGAADASAVALPDRDLMAIARRDLERIMSLSAVPEFVRIFRHRRGIPQYVKGHLDRMHRVDTLLTAHPGLFLAGNSYRGVSMNACIAAADRIADDVLRSIGVVSALEPDVLSA